MSCFLLCVTSGRGPRECRIAAFQVAQEIKKEAMELGLNVTSSINKEDNMAQYSSIVLSIDGDTTGNFVRSWIGTVQWIAKSSFRSKRSRQNWFVGVHNLGTPPKTITINESDITFETMRAGGPGGQHQNKTESAVRALHLPTGFTSEARDGRSQHQNKAKALARLKDLLWGQEAQKREAANHKEWLSKISVERGNPIRTYEEGVQR